MRLHFLMPLLFALTAVECVAQRDADSPTASGLHPRVRFNTTLGDFVVELDAEAAPLTAMNFAGYVEDKFYDGLIFHRVLRGRLIQGGAYTSSMDLKTKGKREPVKHESTSDGTRNVRGSIAMSRELGRPHSATTEYFINATDNPALDRAQDGLGYTVFGKVVEGLETIDKIAATPVGAHPKYAAGRSGVVPVAPVVIKSARMLTLLDRRRAEGLVAEAERNAQEQRDRAGPTMEMLLKKAIDDIEKEAHTKMVTTESGLMYADVRQGSGLSPTLEDTVEMHFRGALLDGTVLNDTYQDEEPPRKKVATLVKGLREGVTTMKEGGKRMLIVPSELAFGKDGIPQKAPPGATLVYEVELLQIFPPSK